MSVMGAPGGGGRGGRRRGRDAPGSADPAYRSYEQHRLLDYMAPDALGHHDPEPWTPYQGRAHRQGARKRVRRRPRAWVLLVALAVAAWGGVELYDRAAGFVGPASTTGGPRAEAAPPDPVGAETRTGATGSEAASPQPGTPPPPPRRAAASLEPAADVRARALVGSSVPLAVRVGDEAGADVREAPVRFAIVEGTGAVDPRTAVTDHEGVARAALLLPPRPGQVVAEASIQGAELPPVRFTVDVRTGPASRLLSVRGDHQQAEAGDPLAEPIVVRVADELDNPVVGVEVFFEAVAGGGAVTPARALTDSSGVAAASWRLGDTPGTQLASARAPAVGYPATFTATARGVAAAGPEPPLADAAAGVPGGDPRAGDPSSGAGAGRVPPPPSRAELGRGGAGYAEPAVTVERRDFDVGGTHVCVLSGGIASCRGANDRGQSSASASGVMAVTAGLSHACALDSDGTASCWGANDSGQLGDGSREDRRTPSPVATDLRFSTITAGASHTCGITAWGQAACWGQNLSGQLGDGSRGDRVTPVSIEGAFGRLVAGWSHTCGVTMGGELYCWGSNSDGQIGDGTNLDRLAPRWIGSAYESVVAGASHTCAIRSGNVVCWGDNAFGQLGDGTTSARNEPTPVANLPGRPVRLAAGAVHTCALLDDGSAFCWGQNRHGQLGDGTTMNAQSPTPVTGGLSFTALSAGGAVTCGLTDDGARYCWGLNQSGQLGDGSRTSRSSPVAVGG